jgi:hypothetical protein
LLIGDLAQLVLTLGLEVQRGHVVEHDRQAPVAGGAGVAGLGDHGPVVALDHSLEAAHERHPVRGRDPELGQNPDCVELAGRLGHPGQHQLPERLVAEPVQPEGVVQAGQDLPQDEQGGALDHRRHPSPARATVVQVQGQLPGMATFLGHLEQHGQLVLGVGRTDVLNAQHPTAPLLHDLDRGRARGGHHTPHEHAHTARLPTRTQAR